MMLKRLAYLLVSSFVILACRHSEQYHTENSAWKEMNPYMDMISADELSASLHFLASDNLEGRGTGTHGQVTAAYYLASSLAKMGVAPAQKQGKVNPLENYFQLFPFERRGEKGTSQNVLGFIEGSDSTLKKEIIILSAHYDHLGKDNKLEGDQIFNGAADDGSGTVALLEVAESFMEAKKHGKGPKRSILISFFSGEEIGIQGSGYFVTESPLSIDKVVTVINLDGVGGFDSKNPSGSDNYVYVLQNDSTSSHLENMAKKLNTIAGINLNIVKPLNPEKFASDSKSFEYMLIPTLYFSTGLTEHYHQVTDEPGTIDYTNTTKIVKLVFAVTWELSNSDTITGPLNRQDYEPSGKYFCPPCGCSLDTTLFDTHGKCPGCMMPLKIKWKKRS